MKITQQPKNLFKKTNLGKNNFEVLDFKNISKLNYLCNIIISQRGKTGKTYNAKEFILEEYLKYGKISGWILNTQIQLQDTYKDFLKYNLLNSDKWDNVIITKSGLYLNKILFCRFLTISGAGKHKSNRVVLDYVFYDEMNECVDKIMDTLVDNYFSILFTSTDPILNKTPQQFIFCNQKSMGTPLFEKFEIVEILGPFMTTENYLMIYTPKVDDIKDIRQHTKDNLSAQFLNLCKLGGVYEKDVLNINKIDNIWGIIPFNKLSKDFLKEGTIIKTKKRYYDIYKNKNIWYFKNIERPKTGKNVVVYKKWMLKMKQHITCFYEKKYLKK